MKNQKIINSFDEDEDESEIYFNILNIIETNQMNIQINPTKLNEEIKSIKSLTLSDNKSLRFNLNDRNNKIEVIEPYIGKKRLRKIFRARKKKGNNDF